MKRFFCVTLVTAMVVQSSGSNATESPTACREFEGVRLVVDVGMMRSEVPSLTQEDLTEVLIGVAQQHASKAVQFRQGLSAAVLECAAARKIALLRIDGVALACQRVGAAPAPVKREARVDFIVRRLSDQTLQAVLHGKAAAPSGAGEDTGLCRDLIQAASSSAIAAFDEPGATW